MRKEARRNKNRLLRAKEKAEIKEDIEVDTKVEGLNKETKESLNSQSREVRHLLEEDIIEVEDLKEVQTDEEEEEEVVHTLPI